MFDVKSYKNSDFLAASNPIIGDLKRHIITTIDEIKKVTSAVTTKSVHLDICFSFNVDGVNLGVFNAGFAASFSLGLKFATDASGLITHMNTYNPPAFTGKETAGDLIVAFFKLFPPGTQLSFEFKVAAKFGVDAVVVNVGADLGFGFGGVFITV